MKMYQALQGSYDLIKDGQKLSSLIKLSHYPKSCTA